ncbi:MAG: hypothetical protein CMP98_03400 [Gammaproteobacteria bacterium]|nr:hypothetical protein [Gammaproteobacteria bacterium]OUU11068.1 MAG: hypothetical protein CBB94_03515 [Gammaproteobacteria bacterium TMED34]
MRCWRRHLRLFERSKTKEKEATGALAGSAVITFVIEMPATLYEDEMETQIIKVEADNFIPYSWDEVSVDYEGQGPSLQNKYQMEVLLAACRRENVETRQAAVEHAGCKCKVVDIEAHSMYRAFNLVRQQFETDSDKNQVVAITDTVAIMIAFRMIIETFPLHNREQLFGGKQLTREIQHRYSWPVEEAGLLPAADAVGK